MIGKLILYLTTSYFCISLLVVFILIFYVKCKFGLELQRYAACISRISHYSNYITIFFRDVLEFGLTN